MSSRDVATEEHSALSFGAAASHAYAPPPLVSRPTALSVPVLNPALSEDSLRRPVRPPLPNLLKDSAVRSLSAQLGETGRPLEIGLEDAAKAVLDEMMLEFLTDVGQEAARVAKRRRMGAVHGRDLGVVLNKRYGLNVPGSNCGAVMPLQQSGAAGNEHMKRMAAIRKVNMQANRQRYR